MLLGVVAVVLIDRNRRFLVGMEVSPTLLNAARARLGAMSGVSSIGYLHMEYVGPRHVYLVASVDLVGDDAESSVADHRARTLEGELEQDESVVEAVLTVFHAEATARRRPRSGQARAPGCASSSA